MGNRSALAAIFMRGGTLPSPLALDPEEQRGIESIGGGIADVKQSLNALDGSLVLKIIEDGEHKWRFKHPTVRDAFAEIVASDIELLDIYLRGSSIDRLMGEVSCGDLGIEGVKVIIPINRYEMVIERFETLDLNRQGTRRRFCWFLSWRCDRDFLASYLERHPSFINGLQVGYYLYAVVDVDVIVRLHQFGLLPEEKRRSVIVSIMALAVRTPDAGFLNGKYRALFTDGELDQALASVRNELLPELENTIDDWRCNYGDDDPEDHFQPLIEALKSYRNEFSTEPDSIQYITEALEQIEAIIDELRSEYGSRRDSDFYDDTDRTSIPSASSMRSVFDDVDQ
uniref:Uncharacterized protein n=1 Tax=Candidatus Kentrum sp. DK TaxID=2126562 RepID=A0A450SDP2_9GAMM|nr:MAG: hypothetical protein BECKDK2373C_GA0170839_102936 [Candidatus Kentron sp. DK]